MTNASTKAYLSAREQAVKTVRQTAQHQSAKTQDALSDEALAHLQTQLRQVIGPVHVPGFPTEGKISLETLLDDLGYGKLDGLELTSTNGQLQLLVSNPVLLDDWIRHFADAQNGLPRALAGNLPATLESEAFYTQALETDVHVFRYAVLPVHPHGAHDTAVAILYRSAQDWPTPTPPDSVAVSVVSGDKVFVLRKQVKVSAIQICTDTLQHGMQPATEAYRRYQASHLRDEASFQRYTELIDEANLASLRCYARELPRQPGFAALTQQAQGLIDLVVP